MTPMVKSDPVLKNDVNLPLPQPKKRAVQKGRPKAGAKKQLPKYRFLERACTYSEAALWFDLHFLAEVRLNQYPGFSG